MATGALTGWITRHRAELRLSVRITVAALLSFTVGHLLHLQQSYWAVITAVIVMQASVGGSLKATFDRFLGTVGGSIWGVAVSLTVPHGDPVSLGVALGVTVAPLAVIAALKPAYRVAPITAIILLITPSNHVDPLVSATNRILEIGLGSLLALGVALLILPARAHVALGAAAGRALAEMAELTVLLTADIARPADPAAVQVLHDRIRRAIGQAEAAAEEANRERSSHLADGPDPEPLCRNIRRIRNDLAIIGRAVTTPLPEPALGRLTGPVARSGAELAVFFTATAGAIATRGPAPSPEAARQGLAGVAVAVADLRHEGLTIGLPDEAVGRVFSLAFGFDQVGGHLGDLVDRTGELARSRPPRGGEA